MAKIREALWKVDGPRSTPAGALSDACPAVAGNETSAAENDVPFIEVGGPHKMVEGSPSVMSAASSAPVVTKVLPAPVKPNVESAAITSPAAKPALPAGVMFRPLARMEPVLPPPGERFARELVAFHQPDDPVSEQYRVLVRDLGRQLQTGKAQALLLAPAKRRSDLAVAALNLAVTKAREGTLPVVVMDAEATVPGFAELLGLPRSPGLRDVLCGATSLQRALRETGLAGLHALTAGTQEAAGLISNDAMRAVLRHLRGRFGWIVIAAPTWDGRSELMNLGSACDAVYLVVSEAEAETFAVQELIRLIPRQGTPLRGCICTP